MPPLPADFIHARACKLKCEKILTRPRGQPLFVPFSGEKGNVKALSHRRPVGAGSMKVLLRAPARQLEQSLTRKSS